MMRLSVLSLLPLLVGMSVLAKNPGRGLARDPVKGRKLAQKIFNRNKGKAAVSIAKMTLKSRSGRVRNRKLMTYERRPKKGQVETLIRFLSPKSVNGTGLLTLNSSGHDSDQWVYLPALSKTRRITSSGSGGRFAGSDFFYEDLKERAVDKDKHYFIKKTKYEGIEVSILESVPVNRKNSVYSKKISWVHRDIYIPLKIDFYQSSKKVKTLQSKKIENINGIWTVMETEMTTHKSGHTSKIINTSVKYLKGLKKDLFTQKVLADPGREKSMR